MGKISGSQIKSKLVNKKQDLDRIILNVANESLRGIRTQVKKHTSLNLDDIELNSDLARNVAVKVLEKAQEIRKNLSKEELIAASKRASQKWVEKAKSSIPYRASEKK